MRPGTNRRKRLSVPGLGIEARDGGPWMRPIPGWRAFALLLVVAAHAWLGWRWANYRPDGRPPATHAASDASDVEVVTVLSFEVERTPAAPGEVAQKKHHRSPQARTGPAGLPASAVADALAPTSIAARTLDLRVSPAPQAGFAPRDPFAHAQPLEQVSTRFDDAWISQGNLDEVAARRSRLAGIVLGALGALRKPCTARQRRDYDPECVPEQYRHTGSDDED
jgi:hypothetical protein